ncbi:MAG: hypothetical protein NY202_02990 [Mollicutes bacterium UO1]
MVCQRAGKSPRQCAARHDPEDTQHPDGDVMLAHTTDQSLVTLGWEDTHTTYTKLETYTIPGQEGTWVDNYKKPGAN